MKIQDAVLQRIETADRAGANVLLDKWAAEHGYERLLTDVIEPVLRLVGEQFAAGREWSVAQAYVAAKVTEDMLEKLAAQHPPQADESANKGPVVIGNIEDDYHALGRRMVATYLRAYGWLVYDLGNDVSAEEFVDKAVAVGAKIIGASAMMHATALNIRRLREEIDNRGLKDTIKLAAGGAAFVWRPELVNEVGADGTAQNALDVPQLFDELFRQAYGSQKKVQA